MTANSVFLEFSNSWLIRAVDHWTCGSKLRDIRDERDARAWDHGATTGRNLGLWFVVVDVLGVQADSVVGVRPVIPVNV